MKREEVEKLGADIARLLAERATEQSPSPDAPPLLTADDVGRKLQINRQAVYRLAREGVLPAVVLGVRSYRWTEQAVIDFVSRGGIAVQREQQTNSLRLMRSRA